MNDLRMLEAADLLEGRGELAHADNLGQSSNPSNPLRSRTPFTRRTVLSSLSLWRWPLHSSAMKAPSHTSPSESIDESRSSPQHGKPAGDADEEVGRNEEPVRTGSRMSADM